MAKSTGSLKAVVGASVYNVWSNMLRELVPWGRTHRLAPLLAGMLQYASALAAKHKDAGKEGSVAWRLVAATEMSDPEEVQELLLDLIRQLFKDAKVRSDRTSARGIPYSIVEEAIYEYAHWEDMPWK